MSRREWNTVVREPWNPKIHNILQTIDLHSKMLLDTQDTFHQKQSDLLRQYVYNLKEWIHQNEK